VARGAPRARRSASPPPARLCLLNCVVTC
jgi:hypothetical protein